MIDPDFLKVFLDLSTRLIEIAGVSIIVIGAVATSYAYVSSRMHGGDSTSAFRDFRTGLGRTILLGLEFLVAADIINTVAIEPSLQSVSVLGGIVLIRTFLSFSLEVEIQGRWPWQTAQEAGAPARVQPERRISK